MSYRRQASDVLEDSDWVQFAGRCLLVGVQLDLPMGMVLDYFFESYHRLTLEEVPPTDEELRADMVLMVQTLCEAN